MADRLLTVKDVAEFFNCKECTVRNWVRSKSIRHTRTPSGGIRFRKQWLNDYVEKHARGGRK